MSQKIGTLWVETKDSLPGAESFMLGLGKSRSGVEASYRAILYDSQSSSSKYYDHVSEVK